jgi:hypothetical protein
MFGFCSFGQQPFSSIPSIVILAIQRQGGGALVVYLTGATSDGGTQSLSANSLGNFKSATQALGVGFTEIQAPPNLVTIAASRANGLGTGSLLIQGANTVTYSAPGGTPGTSVVLPFAEPIVVSDGANPSAWVTVVKTTTNNLIGTSAIQFVEAFNNVFAGDDETNTSGSSKYRAVMLQNASLAPITNLTIWINPLASPATCLTALGASGSGTLTAAQGSFDSWSWQGWALIQTSGGATREYVYYNSRSEDGSTLNVALRGLLGTTASAGSAGDILNSVPPVLIALESPSPAIAGSIQTVASETTQPSGRTFVSGITSATGLSVPALPTENEVGLWIERQVPSGVTAYSQHLISLGVQFTSLGVTYNDQYNGQFRIEDPTLPRYELLIGTNAPPAIGATPVATSATKPFTYSLTPTPSSAYYLMTNYRNQHNLVSEGIDYEVLYFNSSGNPAMPPPTPPVFTVEATAGGSFIITARYFYLSDATAEQANSFNFYLATNGNPLGASPVNIPFAVSGQLNTPPVATKIDGAYFQYILTTSTYSVPSTLSVVVRTLRTSDTTESTNTAIETATSEATDFGPPTLTGVWLQVAQQSQ